MATDLSSLVTKPLQGGQSTANHLICKKDRNKRCDGTKPPRYPPTLLPLVPGQSCAVRYTTLYAFINTALRPRTVSIGVIAIRLARNGKPGDNHKVSSFLPAPIPRALT
jgi:hypothetical protein